MTSNKYFVFLGRRHCVLFIYSIQGYALVFIKLKCNTSLLTDLQSLCSNLCFLNFTPNYAHACKLYCAKYIARYEEGIPLDCQVFILIREALLVRNNLGNNMCLFQASRISSAQAGATFQSWKKMINQSIYFQDRPSIYYKLVFDTSSFLRFPQNLLGRCKTRSEILCNTMACYNC